MSLVPQTSSTRESSRSREASDIEKATGGQARQGQWTFAEHFDAEVDPRGVDVLILCCWFVTGFLDSTIFNAYRTFVSMQTGNTIFIGLGASPNPSTNRPYGWLKSLSSLLTFLLGCIFFSRLALALGPLRRITFTISFVIQTSFLLLAAILVQTSIIESRLEYLSEDIDWMHLLPIILLSFQAPGQTCMGRQLGMSEVPTVVVTTMIYDFASDEGLFTGLRGNAKRNRRMAGLVTMLVGAIAGGWVTVWTSHIVASLWVAVAIKSGMTVAWICWPKKRAAIES